MCLSFSSSSEGGTFLLRRRDRCPQCTLHGQVQLLVLLPCLLSSGGGPAAGEGGLASSAFRPGVGVSAQALTHVN